jgi:signal transduction histidine kinase/CheY-like chemotaxis protein
LATEKAGSASKRTFALLVFSLGFVFCLSFFLLESYSYNKQKRLVINTYLDLESTIVDRTVDTAERWFRSRIGGSSLTGVENEIFRYFVDPIHILQNGDAWIYNRDYVLFDQSSDFPEQYRGKPIDEIFRMQAKSGASHFDKLVEGVLSAGSGKDWYVWRPSKGREWAAWKSFSFGDHTWTLGLSTPEDEILENYGVHHSSHVMLLYGGFILIIFLASMLVLLRWYSRNLDLAEELDRTVKRLHAANEAKSAFTAVVSHELRNPLNAIIGLVDLDLGQDLDPALRNDLEVVHASGKVLLGLVNDLLDLSKIEANKMELELLDFDLDAQLSSALHAFAQAAEDKGIALDAVIAGGTPRFVRGDPLRFGQILMNLVSNAVKFTEVGGVLVEFAPEALPTEPGDPRIVGLRCTVRDSGIGVEADKLPRLFHEFSQADMSISRRYGGTGLGLSICKRLVELFGGEISVDSKPGEGSAFSFTARFEPGDEAAVRKESCRDNGEAAKPACSLAILVVDDDPVNLAIARRYLERAGHKTACASNGAEAIVLASSLPFDLVLLDLGLPDMDGIEACRRLIAESGPKRAHSIAAMTARSDSGTRAACASAGMIDCLTKPVEPEALDRLLEGLMAERRALGPRAAASVAQREHYKPEDEAAACVAPGWAPLIDGDALLKRVDGDRDFMRELLSIFVSEEEGRRAELNAALSSRDAQALHRATHKLKGSAPALCAFPLERAAASLNSVCASYLRDAPQAGTDGQGAFDTMLAGRTAAVLDILGRSVDEAKTLLG